MIRNTIFLKGNSQTRRALKKVVLKYKSKSDKRLVYWRFKARLHRRFLLRSFSFWCMRLNGLTYDCIINQYFRDSIACVRMRKIATKIARVNGPLYWKWSVTFSSEGGGPFSERNVSFRWRAFAQTSLFLYIASSPIFSISTYWLYTTSSLSQRIQYCTQQALCLKEYNTVNNKLSVSKNTILM